MLKIQYCTHSSCKIGGGNNPTRTIMLRTAYRSGIVAPAEEPGPAVTPGFLTISEKIWYSSRKRTSVPGIISSPFVIPLMLFM